MYSICSSCSGVKSGATRAPPRALRIALTSGSAPIMSPADRRRELGELVRRRCSLHRGAVYRLRKGGGDRLLELAQGQIFVVEADEGIGLDRLGVGVAQD